MDHASRLRPFYLMPRLTFVAPRCARGGGELGVWA